MIDATVILCVRNGASTIGEQLAALAAQDCSRAWELLVVDNRSTDDTLHVVSRWRERIPALRVVQAHDRQGLAYARNVGAGAAQGSLLAFCDADDVADSGWLGALIAGAQSADIVGGRLGLELLNDTRTRSWRWLPEPELGHRRALGHLHYAVGANFAVRREVYADVGGCDEAFISCGDDIDLSWRIQDAGGRLIFRDDAVMHYRLRPDLRGLIRQQYLYGRMEGLLRKKFGDQMPPARWSEQWPLYRHLVTRSWHLLADSRRRGSWLARASYCAGRLSGAVSYRVVHF